MPEFKRYPATRFLADLTRPAPWATVVVAVFVFLAPNFDFAPDLTWHDGQRLAQLGLFGILLLAFAAPGVAARAVAVWSGLGRMIRLAMAAAFGLGLVSSLLAPLPRWALLDWGLLLLLLLLALQVAADRRAIGARMDVPLVLLFFSTAAAYSVTVCFIYAGMLVIGVEYGQAFNMRELYPGISNVRFFGYVQTMLLPFLLLPVFWWGTTGMRKLLWWSVPAVWWMLAVGSGTRGTWVALLVGVCAAALYGGHAGRRWIRWQFAGLCCGLLCYALFVLLIPLLIDQQAVFLHRAGDLVSLSLREVLWKTSLEFIAQHPWLGVGPMHYAYFAGEVAAHPHNALLQWAAEWGIPAAVLLGGVCAVAGLAFAGHVGRAAREADDRGVHIKIALLAALAGIAAQAMVDGVLVMPVSQVLLALLCGWALGMAGAERDLPVAGQTGRALFIISMLFAVVLVIWGAAPEIGHLAERQQAYLLAHPEKPLLPRFWALGWIRE